MARPGFGGGGQLGVGGLLVSFGLLFAPSSAMACTPQDPQGQGQLDVCQQTFTYYCPTAANQAEAGFAIENIPAGAVSISHTLTFSGNCPSATESDSFEPAATSKNPDGTSPSPGPGEQAARVNYSWTGTGPSAGGSGTATYTVKFEEKVRDLQVELLADDQSGTPITSIRAGQPYHYIVGITNPNDDPVDVYPDPVYHTFLPYNFVVSSIQGYGLTCGLSQSGDSQRVDCSGTLPAGGMGSVRIDGATYSGLGGGSQVQGSAETLGTQISDGQQMGSNRASNTVVVSNPLSASGNNTPPPNTVPGTTEAADDPPVACFSFIPAGPLADQQTYLDAGCSHDPDEKIISYRWQFGDGSTGHGAQATQSHTYSHAGYWNVTLIVLDAAGLAESTTMAVTVSQPVILPLAEISPSGTGSTTANCPAAGRRGHNSVLTPCILLLSLGYPTAAKRSRDAGPSARIAGLVTIGTARGKVPAARKGKISIKLTRQGLNLLRKKHQLTFMVTGTRKQGRTTTPVRGSLTLRLRH